MLHLRAQAFILALIALFVAIGQYEPAVAAVLDAIEWRLRVSPESNIWDQKPQRIKQGIRGIM